LPLLRDLPNDLFALVGRASQARGLAPEFVEKDFWTTEVLRAATNSAAEDSTVAIFKGGTSLARGFGLLERFSDDVDLLLVPPPLLGKAACDKMMKRIAVAVAEHLGTTQELRESTTGIKRNVRFPYPRRFESARVAEGVLLEMGVRGGDHPRQLAQIRSMVSEWAMSEEVVAEKDFEEMASVDVQVLSPERTLIEKLSMLHYLATRHDYDIYRLLAYDPVCEALRSPGTASDLAVDVERHSRKYGWPASERPPNGYADSPAFDPGHASHAKVRAAYEDVRGLLWGEFPDLEAVLRRVYESRDLL
jgi:predicted nucleotidyltransferase component of viral defense system